MTDDATDGARSDSRTPKIVEPIRRQSRMTTVLVIELQRVPATLNRSVGVMAEPAPAIHVCPLPTSPACGGGREGQQEKRGCPRRRVPPRYAAGCFCAGMTVEM